ncbi:MAG TPA: hypothetical protein VHJ17_22930, partial [Thermomonospora sp.]|nr:hypothetical protein [Thermomonospora sp.]
MMRQTMLTAAMAVAVPVLPHPSAWAAAPAPEPVVPKGAKIRVVPVGVEPTGTVDEKRVCRFYLAATGFRGLDHLGYRINRVSDSSRVTVSGALYLENGSGTSRHIRVPDGRYTISWSAPGASAAAGHKVITVACNAPAGTPAATATGNTAGQGAGTPGKAPGTKGADTAAPKDPAAATEPDGPYPYPATDPGTLLGSDAANG